MIYYNEVIYGHVVAVIEFLGTFAFAISGIRHAAAKKFDWFGGFVCGVAVAIGGGTLRDMMLGLTPFWMTSSYYLVCTFMAQVFVIIFAHSLKRLDNTWFFFDTIGLALFTVAGLQKTLDCGHPFWVAIIMGTITGSAGGVIRDVLLNNVPVIFRKEIYAMASVLGGFAYWVMMSIGLDISVAVTSSFFIIVLIRVFAVKYHISLPVLKGEEDDDEEENVDNDSEAVGIDDGKTFGVGDGNVSGVGDGKTIVDDENVGVDYRKVGVGDGKIERNDEKVIDVDGK